MVTADTTVPAENSYRRWQVQILVATWLGYVGYYFCRKSFYVVKAAMGDALPLSTQDLAHLGTGYLVGYMVGQFSSAYAGRRLGPRRLLLAGMAISLACNVVFGAANSFWTVMLFMLLNGMAQGTGWPGCIGSLAFWFKREQRGSVLGLWSTCYQLGPAVASSFAAFILGRAGWRWAFYGSSMVLLLVWFLVLVLHPNRPEDVGLAPLEDDDEPATPGQPEVKVNGLGWTPAVVRTILMMGTIYFCIKFLRYTLWSWAAFFLSRNFGEGQEAAGYLSTVFEVCGFAGVIVAGFASDRLFHGRRALLSLLMISLMTVSFFLMWLGGAHSEAVFTVSMGLVGFMLFGPDSLLSGAGAIDVGSRKGALVAAGIINGMGSIGPIFQEQLVAWLYDAYHQELTPVLVMLVVVSLMCTAFTALLWLSARRGDAKI